MSSPGDSDDKESAGNTGDPGLVPGSGRSCGGGNGNPVQYSCLENLMDRQRDGFWSVWAAKTTEQLIHTHRHLEYNGLLPP